MTGFTAEDATGLTLRANETATVKIKMVASGGQSEVTIYGTTQGVRADPQIGFLTKRGILRPIVIPKYKNIPVFIIKNNLRSSGISRDSYFELLGECQ